MSVGAKQEYQNVCHHVNLLSTSLLLETSKQKEDGNMLIHVRRDLCGR